MKEVKRELKAYQVDAYCDCGGKLRPTGYAYPTDPMQYPHVCNTCGHRETLRDSYPTKRFEFVNQEETQP